MKAYFVMGDEHTYVTTEPPSGEEVAAVEIEVADEDDIEKMNVILDIESLSHSWCSVCS